MILVCNSMSILCSLSLYLNVIGSLPMSLPFCLLTIFSWGLAWALPFYIPPGILALELGGKLHAALLTNLFDGAGFLLSAAFSKVAMDQGGVGRWSTILLGFVISSFITTISMGLSMSKSAVSVSVSTALTTDVLNGDVSMTEAKKIM